MNCGGGESIRFETAIEIKTAVHETSSHLEKEMRNTLQKRLLAVDEFRKF